MRALSFLAILSVAAPSGASAHPVASRPVGPEFFTGRWFEIARSVNPGQKDCEAPTYDFAKAGGDGPRFVLTCRKGSPTGPADRLAVRVRLPASEDRARFRVTALGGLVGADYVVLDHDEAYSWALLTMGDGRLVWFLARTAKVDEALRNRVVQRMARLGYKVGSLVFPRW
jgi:apolipoprotein D and lipocalin family protein